MRDYLWLNIRDLPYFRGLLRGIEARFYEDIALPGPVFDLGCGDGHFITTAFDNPVDVGADPWTGPLRQASRRGGYRLVIQAFGDRLPFPDSSFSSAMSNSVLEHIPDIDAVLVEMARILKPGGLFVFCVPNHNFLSNLSVSRFLDRIGLRGLADLYRRFFNRISRHHHCDSPEVWTKRLEAAGFSVERWWHYFSPRATHVLEWGHYFGLPSLVTHFLFRRWNLVPARWNLALTRRLVEPYYNEPRQQENGSYSFYIVRNK